MEGVIRMVGERIVLGRKLRGMSRKRLSERSGISYRKLWLFEQEVTIPTSEELSKIASALYVPVEFLLRPNTVNISDFNNGRGDKNE